jgi:hypothetical protein
LPDSISSGVGQVALFANLTDYNVDISRHRAFYLRLPSEKIGDVHHRRFIPDHKTAVATVKIIMVKSLILFVFGLIGVMTKQNEASDPDHLQHLNEPAKWIKGVIQRVATMYDIE